MSDDENDPCWSCNAPDEEELIWYGEKAQEMHPCIKCALLSVPVIGLVLAAAFLASALVLLNVLFFGAPGE